MDQATRERIEFETHTRMQLAFLSGRLGHSESATWMEELDDLVGRYPDHLRYAAAKLIYERVNAGAALVPIALPLLYAWCVKWATLPEARGRVSAA